MVQVVTNTLLSKPVKGIPTPSVAYVLYEANGGVCAATRHEIEEGALGIGRAISLRSLGQEFARVDESGHTALLPANVLASSASVIVWTTSSRVAPMWFHVMGRHRAFNVEWPHLLWILERRKRVLRIFALGSGRRPCADTRVYHAPLMNIGPNGSLCEGSAQLPRDLEVANLEAVQACVYESCFTHVNHERTLKGGADNRQHVAYWRAKERARESVRVSELNYVGVLKAVLP